jgi:aquaporin Z
MRVYLTEFIGTFFLVLTVGLTVLSETPFAALAVGGSLMVMVFMGGHISGAHYNPAVSFAVALRRRLSWGQMGAYMASQILGALVAALLVQLIMGRTFAPEPAHGLAAWKAVLVEGLYTFALALVVLNVATIQKTKGNSFYGLAIGFTIVVAVIAGGPLTGGAFNPAVGIGPIVVHSLLGDGSPAWMWLYVVGPMLGALVAAGVFRLQGED